MNAGASVEPRTITVARISGPHGSLEAFARSPDDVFLTLEEPLACDRFSAPVMTIRGWVCARGVEVVELFVASSGIRLLTVTDRVERADLRRVVGETAALVGAEAYAFQCTLPTAIRSAATWSFVVRYRKNGGLEERIVAGIDLAAAGAGTDDRLVPVLITSVGRSGSTLLHQLLCEHELAAGDRTYPREAKPAQAIALDGVFWRSLGAWPGLDWGGHLQVDPAQSTRAGLNILLQDRPENYAALFDMLGRLSFANVREAVERIYARFYGLTGLKRLLIEKSSSAGSAFMMEYFFPKTKEILLIRHPLDVLLSMRSYHRRSAPNDFRFASGALDAAMAALSQDYTALIDARRLNPGGSRIVRYEDLVRDPAAVLGGICEFIGFPVDAARLHAMVAAGGVRPAELPHVTATDAAGAVSAGASLQRWKRELSEAEIAMGFDRLGDVIRKLGYGGPEGGG